MFPYYVDCALAGLHFFDSGCLTNVLPYYLLMCSFTTVPLLASPFLIVCVCVCVYIHTHITYIYIRVCVCVCVCITDNEDEIKLRSLSQADLFVQGVT